MGNSPSKNDPSPNNQSSSATTGIPDGELEAEESAPALSQLSSSSLYSNGSTRSSAIDIGASSASAFHSNYYKKKNDTPNTNSTTKKISPPPPPPPVATSPKKSRKSSFNQDLDLDLEIGASMAQLLKTTNSSAYGSSVDSVKSDASTMSPVFTTVGESKDEDSLSSLGSTSPFGKTYYYKSDSKDSLTTTPPSSGSVGSNNNNTNGLVKRLDAISEATESGPLPSKSKPLSLSNLKKHDLKSSAVLGEALTKNVSSSSSNLSNSPPLIPTTKKVDIDLEGVIDRLLDIGMSKKSNSSSRRALKDKLPVTTSEIKYILHKSRSIFLEQPTLLRLSPPVKVVGDIHGQFHDLIRIFNSCGYPPYSNYLFLGDYVDRGHKSLETILLLLCYKIKYPENFFMLRGNHESANITKIYGFYDECKRRLPNHKLWKVFVDVFNTLPIAATINDKIFCIHGGLSPDLHDLKQIENIKRPTDIPDKGLLADLLWSDPDPSVKYFSVTNWPKNDRGVSYCFGRKHVDYFCNKFKMDLIVRGHMVVEDGYEFFNKRKLVTVFSAPNYCGEFNNFGAVMSVDKSLYCSFELIKPQ